MARSELGNHFPRKIGDQVGRADWVLLDYFDFVVHVFTPVMREFYALDRLWGSAERIAVPEPQPRITAKRP